MGNVRQTPTGVWAVNATAAKRWMWSGRIAAGVVGREICETLMVGSGGALGEGATTSTLRHGV